MKTKQLRPVVELWERGKSDNEKGWKISEDMLKNGKFHLHNLLPKTYLGCHGGVARTPRLNLITPLNERILLLLISNFLLVI